MGTTPETIAMTLIAGTYYMWGAAGREHGLDIHTNDVGHPDRAPSPTSAAPTSNGIDIRQRSQ